MKTACSIAVGIQVVSIVSILLGLGYVPSALLSVTTILVLLRTVKRVDDLHEEKVVEKRVTERTRALEEKVVHYEMVASTDALTGLLNRRGIEAAISPHIARSKRLGTAFSFILCDIDHFKSVNDKFGHSTGDMVIAGVAKSIRETIRAADVAGRWGGEEFLICLPDTDLAGAIMTAEKLRLTVERIDFDIPSVTISLGCAELGEDPFHLALARADMHLYMAKSKGRNQVFPNSLQKMLDRS